MNTQQPTRILTLTLLATVVVGLALPATTASAQDGAGVAYVDIQRAIREVDDGQRAMRQLTEQLEERQRVLDSTETELRELTSQLESEIEGMDEATRAQRLQEYQQRIMEYQQQYQTNQRALLEMEAEATAEIVQRMVAIVATIAEERGISMVFEKQRSAVVWAATSLDLTDELIRRYEEAH